VIVYLDTSAFVKLIIDEPASQDVHAWFTGAQQAVSSVITYPEASAALFRRDRESSPAPARLRSWVAQLDARWLRTFAVPVAERPAGQLALRHGLRGMDAVQLAAAVSLRWEVHRTSPHSDIAFAAFDRELLEAAEREGFATLGRSLV
jgi:predicted nucleic acid-binding protein